MGDRLISANALLEQIKNPYTEYPVMIKIRKAIEDMINETPTVSQSVESVEIKHGRWIFNPKDAIEMMFTLPKCSECGAESPNGGNYCSNCGAKMDEVEEDE